VLVDARAVLDLFDLDDVGLLPRFTGLLFLFVLQLASIEDPYDRRIGTGTDLDEIQAAVLGPLAGFVQGNDTQLGTVDVDQAYRALPNLTIHAGLHILTNL
jgi:hypothetical protein